MARRTVDVVMERVPLANRWVSERWQPVAVIEATPSAASGPAPAGAHGMIASDTQEARQARGIALPSEAGGGRERWICPGFEIELHHSEGEGLYLNMSTPEPRIFVMWRTFDDGRVPRAWPVIVTASYSQAARFMDGGEQVDNVPMPHALAQWVSDFVAANYVPEPRRKYKRRNPLDGNAPETPSRLRGGRGGPFGGEVRR